MRSGIPVYDHVDMLDVTGPFEMFDWVAILPRPAGQQRHTAGAGALPYSASKRSKQPSV